MKNPTFHDVAVDVAKQIHELELRYGFSQGKEAAFMVSYKSVDYEAFGRYQALWELQWRMQNPDWLGKPQVP